MIQNIGFEFDTSDQQWLASFKMALADSDDHYYELLPLEQIEAEESQALASGNMQAVAEYGLAASAIRETNEGLRTTPNDLPSNFSSTLFTEDLQGDLQAAKQASVSGRNQFNTPPATLG